MQFMDDELVVNTLILEDTLKSNHVHYFSVWQHILK